MTVVLTLVAPLALLIWLVYRGWPILLCAPLLAVAAALIGAEPGLATLTQRFMPAAGGFVTAFLPLFLLGAVFGKLMEASGAAMALARAIIGALGPRNAVPAVVLSCAALTYGGVSLFVVAFAVYPLALSLFRAADLPPRFIPAAIALGAFTFTMTALPGTPSIQNAIPMPYFGTTAFAAPGLGLIAGAVMALGGLAYLGCACRSGGMVSTGEKLRADGPPLWAALAPIGAVFAVNWVLAEVVFAAQALNYLSAPEWGAAQADQVIGLWALICALCAAIALSLGLSWSRLTAPKTTLAQGAEAALLPLFNTAALVGFGAVVAALPAFGAVAALAAQTPGGVLNALAVSSSLLAGLTGSASGGMSIALDTLGADALAAAAREGVDPAALHRVVALATGGLDALPHNGAVVTLLGIAGMTHRQAYGPIFVVAVAIPVAALLVVLGLAAQFGSF